MQELPSSLYSINTQARLCQHTDDLLMDEFVRVVKNLLRVLSRVYVLQTDNIIVQISQIALAEFVGRPLAIKQSENFQASQQVVLSGREFENVRNQLRFTTFDCAISLRNFLCVNCRAEVRSSNNLACIIIRHIHENDN